MTLFHRRLIYITFIIIFLVASPLIVLYTMGYRYNFTKGRVQKTGILKITSLPRSADIYLNGVKNSNQTPAKIEKVLPGDYEIKLSKNGYFDWQKKLAVYENGTTFAENVILWKQGQPLTLSTTSPSSWLVSPDKNIIAFANDKNISLLDVNSGIFGEISGGNVAIITTLVAQGEVQLISWSPSGRYLLVQASPMDYYLIDTIAKNNKKITGKNYTNLKWDSTVDNLYGLNKSGLWQIDLSSLKTKLITNKIGGQNFYFYNRYIYWLNNQALSRQTINSQSAVEKIAELSCSVGCQINAIKDGRALVLDSANNNLFIVDLNRQLKTIVASAKNLSWLNDNSLIFYNEFEIYIFNFAKDSPELITRLGTPINAAIWHPEGRHLIFSSDGKIKIIELDNRELRNIIDIASSQANFLTIDRAGNNLYYGIDKQGIFKLNIK